MVIHWVAFFVFIWFLLPYFIRVVCEFVLRQKCKRRGLIVLTYDDGPSPSFTCKILEILDAYNANATFFIQGIKAETIPDVVSLLVSRGHEISSHSYQHLNAWKSLPWIVYKDVKKGIDQIKKVGGSSSFRPPYGKVTLATLIQVYLQRFTFSWWTIDSTDTWEESVDVELIKQRVRNEGGGVVLLHDHERPQNPEREEYVLKVTRSLLEMAKKEGFRVCTMRDLRTI